MAVPLAPMRSPNNPNVGEAVGAVNNFFNLMGNLTSDTSYTYLYNLLKEHSALRDKYDKLEIANDVNLGRFVDVQRLLRDETDRSAKKETDITRLKSEKSDANKRLAEKASSLQNAQDRIAMLEKALEDRDSQIEALHKDVKKEKSLVAAAKAAEKQTAKELDETRGRLADTEQQLGAKMNRLGELDRLSSKMIHLPQDDVSGSLDAIFQSAYGLVEDYFYVDFDDAVLHDADRWSSLLSHDLVRRTIPLPASNSPAAKHTRTAAALAVLAAALDRHLFQPTYLLDNGVELRKVMSDLAAEDPTRETYLRSVMLAAALPAHHAKMASLRVDAAVRDVVACLGPLLPRHREAAFRSALADVCRLACERWARIQKLEEKVESHLEPPSPEEQEAWSLHPLPSPDDPLQDNSGGSGPPRRRSPSPGGQGNPGGGHENSKSPERGWSPTSSSAGGGGGGGGFSAAPSATSTVRGHGDGVVGIVWPSFVELQDGDPELFQVGFGLGARHVDAARREETPKPGTIPRRLGKGKHSSRKSRTLTLNMSAAAANMANISNGNGNGAVSAGDVEKPFLFAGAGNGSKGG